MIRLGFESFHTVAFFAGFAPVPDASKLWSQHFSAPYSNFNRPSAAVSVVTGEMDGLLIELQLHSNRLDLITRPKAQTNGPPPVTPDLRMLSDSAVAWITPMLSTLTVVRQATIANHSQEVSDVAAAAGRMTQILPTLPLKPTDQDISFQVSRRKPSSVQSGLQINRLCRWTTAIGVEFVIPFAGGVASPVSGKEHYMVEEVLDVNTHPDERPNPDLIPSIYEELISEIERIHETGLSALD